MISKDLWSIISKPRSYAAMFSAMAPPTSVSSNVAFWKCRIRCKILLQKFKYWSHSLVQRMVLSLLLHTFLYGWVLPVYICLKENIHNWFCPLTPNIFFLPISGKWILVFSSKTKVFCVVLKKNPETKRVLRTANKWKVSDKIPKLPLQAGTCPLCA